MLTRYQIFMHIGSPHTARTPGNAPRTHHKRTHQLQDARSTSMHTGTPAQIWTIRPHLDMILGEIIIAALWWVGLQDCRDDKR
jgi:hypothetical protein